MPLDSSFLPEGLLFLSFLFLFFLCLFFLFFCFCCFCCFCVLTLSCNPCHLGTWKAQPYFLSLWPTTLVGQGSSSLFATAAECATQVSQPTATGARLGMLLRLGQCNSVVLGGNDMSVDMRIANNNDSHHGWYHFAGGADMTYL